MSVRHAILGLLAQRPRHGYDLRAAFVAVMGGELNWDVKPAQIYTTLERLEQASLVQCESDLGEGKEPSRRVYAITPAGKKVLHEWFTNGITPEHQRDEFFVKLMIATRIYMPPPTCVTATTPRPRWRRSCCWISPSCTWKPTCAGSTSPN
jgi:DNA-binding PadR family transcriptional regulator